MKFAALRSGTSSGFSVQQAAPSGLYSVRPVTCETTVLPFGRRTASNTNAGAFTDHTTCPARSNSRTVSAPAQATRKVPEAVLCAQRMHPCGGGSFPVAPRASTGKRASSIRERRSSSTTSHVELTANTSDPPGVTSKQSTPPPAQCSGIHTRSGLLHAVPVRGTR